MDMAETEQRLNMATTELYEEHGILAYWTGMGSPFVKDMFKDIMDPDQTMFGHACEIETSQVMYLAPWAARENRVKGEVQDSIYTRKIFKTAAVGQLENRRIGKRRFGRR